jgi:hypothetical protein
MNGNAFLVYVEQVLAPTPKPGDIVVLDNLSAHKVPAIREAIEAAVLSCLPIRRTSIRSSNSSPNSKRSSARLPSARSKASGTASRDFSMPSYPMNAPTTSATPDTPHAS